MNLGANACQAMGDLETGAILKVILSYLELQTVNITGGVKIEPGKYIIIGVSDTGHGIDPEILERIFDPYFTTREIGGGAGLGLSVVHGIVKSHKGYITVESQPGKGSTFTIYLPCH
jgi:signal transduction histidine kinase